jgi:hypothetical protein
LALCGAGHFHGDVVDVVRVVLRNEACVEAQVVGSGAPIVGVLSCAVRTAEVLQVLVWTIVRRVVTCFRGFIRGVILVRVDTRELWFVVVVCRVIGLIVVVLFAGFVRICYVFFFFFHIYNALPRD